MSSNPINIHQIKAAFSKYAKEVQKGKSFIIAIRNKPFAELIPIRTKKNKKIVFGVLRNKFSLPDNFNSELEDFQNEYYK